MTKTLYESDENERVQRPLLDDRAKDNNIAMNSDTSNIIIYESPEKEGNVTIFSDSKYSPKDKLVLLFLKFLFYIHTFYLCKLLRFFVVYITCLLFGIASLLPWNIIITATDVIKTI